MKVRKAYDLRVYNKEVIGLAVANLLRRRTLAEAARMPALVTDPTLWRFATERPWEIDRHGFDWQRHKYLVPLYYAVGITEQTDHLSMVVIKGAQIGATVWAMLTLIYLAMKFPSAQLGYFLPDQPMSQLFSVNRFKPMIESNPTVARLVGGMDGDQTNNTRLRTIGDASVYFSYMGGTTSTESLPLLGIFFDEVRRMAATDIGLAEQRISHSPYPVNIKLSTAGYPDADIASYYARSDQREWHTRCLCPDGVILADEWPECLGMHGAEVWYRCPRCQTRIDNPQDGRYLQHAPSQKEVIGFRIPQTVSLAPLHSPAALWAQYIDPQRDRGEFYRSVLGRPYVDPEAQLVTAEQLKACEDPDAKWENAGVNCAMGIDQKSAQNDVVIATHDAKKKLRLVHVERIEGPDPFDSGRLDRLMRDYDIHCCVCDLNPNYNEAMRFAKRWVGRVFLVTYANNDRADMYAWQDRVRRKTRTPNEPEAQFKYLVTLQRYKAIDYALGLFKERLVILPHPRGLTQTIHDDHGFKRPVFVGEELFWPHMQRVIRYKHVQDAEQGTFKMEMIKIGADPHFAFAWTYCVAAASRRAGGRVAIL